MKRPAVYFFALLLGSCSDLDESSPFGYPLDSVLRLNHLQAKGTHNSYHIAQPEVQLIDLAYTLPPLEAQLQEMGVRQFELDVHYQPDERRFAVYHIPILDPGTHCYWFTDCLHIFRSWSDANPGHHPIFIFIEPKDEVDTARITGHYGELEMEIDSVWPRSLRIAPDDVKGSSATLREAVTTRGWPTLGRSRGKAVFVMLDTANHRSSYTENDKSLDGRLMFVTADPEQPFAAVIKMDDPLNAESKIRELVATGFMIRTRADSVDEPHAGDTRRREAALRSGAQFVSTDYPGPGLIANYSVEIPGGSPSRCNPVTAPPECTSSAIEDPARRTLR